MRYSKRKHLTSRSFGEKSGGATYEYFNSKLYTQKDSNEIACNCNFDNMIILFSPYCRINNTTPPPPFPIFGFWSAMFNSKIDFHDEKRFSILKSNDSLLVSSFLLIRKKVMGEGVGQICGLIFRNDTCESADIALINFFYAMKKLSQVAILRPF